MQKIINFSIMYYMYIIHLFFHKNFYIKILNAKMLL